MLKLIAGVLDFQAEKALADRMTAVLTDSLSPRLMGERRHVLSAKRITRLLEHACELAVDHYGARRVGMVRRAVLANAFRWRLKQAGYPDDFINVSTEGLIVSLTRKAVAAKSGR